MREQYPGALDQEYGPAPRNRVDFFDAGEGAPLFVFIHGGYWQMRSKELFAFLVPGLLAHGISVALVGYTLAPEKSLDGIVAEIHAALGFLGRDCVLSGWSAGGHLTAMAMDHPRVRAGLAISGIYDLEPIRLCYLNDKLRLDAESARRLSPLQRPATGKPLVVAYGTGELPELQRQSRAYAEIARGARLEPLAGHDHFTILEELASPSGRLMAIVRTLIES